MYSWEGVASDAGSAGDTSGIDGEGSGSGASRVSSLGFLLLDLVKVEKNLCNNLAADSRVVNPEQIGHRTYSESRALISL